MGLLEIDTSDKLNNDGIKDFINAQFGIVSFYFLKRITDARIIYDSVAVKNYLSKNNQLESRVNCNAFKEAYQNFEEVTGIWTNPDERPSQNTMQNIIRDLLIPIAISLPPLLYELKILITRSNFDDSEYIGYPQRTGNLGISRSQRSTKRPPR